MPKTVRNSNSFIGIRAVAIVPGFVKNPIFIDQNGISFDANLKLPQNSFPDNSITLRQSPKSFLQQIPRNDAPAGSTAYAGTQTWSSVPLARTQPLVSTTRKAVNHTNEVVDTTLLEPFTDLNYIPMNTFGPKRPLEAEIIESKKLCESAHGTHDIYQVRLCHAGRMPYRVGQSVGVINDDFDPDIEKQPKNKLYSIASRESGDLGDFKTLTLLLRHHQFFDTMTNNIDSARRGRTSSLICKSQPGDILKIFGPTGKLLSLPVNLNDVSDIIMVATGSGIAPFRGFTEELLCARRTDTAREISVKAGRSGGDCVVLPPSFYQFYGNLWLMWGGRSRGPDGRGVLYEPYFTQLRDQFPSRFRYDVTLSREGKNPDGSKMYIQDVIRKNGKVMVEKLLNGGHIYFCGLKCMMEGVSTVLADVCAEHFSFTWDELYKTLKEKRQWHVEVY